MYKLLPLTIMSLVFFCTVRFFLN
uniref:Uncharacterized protein n=1 Tax=Anguilla anguilla TaxID=7936 RepID=A0A0E9TQL3_ANGAN